MFCKKWTFFTYEEVSIRQRFCFGPKRRKWKHGSLLLTLTRLAVKRCSALHPPCDLPNFLNARVWDPLSLITTLSEREAALISKISMCLIEVETCRGRLCLLSSAAYFPSVADTSRLWWLLPKCLFAISGWVHVTPVSPVVLTCRYSFLWCSCRYTPVCCTCLCLCVPLLLSNLLSDVLFWN